MFLNFIPYPKSIMPFMNSSFVNSHCVSALNFHAIIKTNLLSGLKPKSSRNFMMPSAVILSDSVESRGKFIYKFICTCLH